jgi:hypothetical protein
MLGSDDSFKTRAGKTLLSGTPNAQGPSNSTRSGITEPFLCVRLCAVGGAVLGAAVVLGASECESKPALQVSANAYNVPIKNKEFPVVVPVFIEVGTWPALPLSTGPLLAPLG